MACTSAPGGCPISRADLASLSSEPDVALSTTPVFFVRRPDESVIHFITELAGPALGASEHEIASFLDTADSLDLIEFWEELRVASGSFGNRVRS